MNNPDQHKNIDYLLFLLVEGSLDAKGFESIETWLSAGPQNQEYYCNFIKDYAAMKMQVNAMLTPEENDSKGADTFDREAWHALAEMENDADIIKIAKKKKQIFDTPQVSQAVPQVERHPINKTSLMTIASLAALIMMIAFVNLFPTAPRESVAMIADAINARWEDSNNPEVGDRLLARDGLMGLQQGIIKIQFDNGAQVIMEAPSRFELSARDQMNLQSGKLYAVVPREAIGFSVITPTARIIDLGTEFGIDASTGGDTSLHVMKGKVTLIAGEQSSKVSMEVGAGYAKKISGAAQEVSDIPCQKELFVRTIDSKEKLVWKGQNQISLADIVGGGNGLGTGRLYTGINPITGQTTSLHFDNRKATNEYRPVASNPFIDGVFVPNCRTEQIISSMGHVFQECPITMGDLWTDIVSMPISSGKEWKPEGISTRGQLMQGANLDSTEEGLVMHANLGITFDLRAIRSVLPDVKITRFRAQFGLAPFNEEMINADFWVLIDGKLKFKQNQVKERGKAGLIDIELSDKDRFLTLVTTDGGDPQNRVSHGKSILTINGDWCVFMEPVLVLE